MYDNLTFSDIKCMARRSVYLPFALSVWNYITPASRDTATDFDGFDLDKLGTFLRWTVIRHVGVAGFGFKVT